MFSPANQVTVSNSLLNEVATSGIFPDPALFVYTVLGALMIGSLLIAYVIFGRTARLAQPADTRARPVYVREGAPSEVSCVSVRGVRHGRVRGEWRR